MTGGATPQNENIGIHPSAGADILPTVEGSGLDVGSAFQATGQTVTSEPSNHQQIQLSPGYEKMGEYLIKISGHILSNLDDVHASMGDEFTKNDAIWDDKSNLREACIDMAAAGAWISINSPELESDFGEAGPAFVKGAIENSSLLAKEIDWLEMGRVIEDIANKYGDQFQQAGQSFSDSNLQGDPMHISNVAQIMSGVMQGEMPNGKLFPDDIALKVNPL
ncbi:hypothetical protein QGP82_21390 [Leptothoe sp. LEGE 181152]|nr:hypothetical protein [Leptothoe sp. LEGE 181152]